jgi:hypothetical protein
VTDSRFRLSGHTMFLYRHALLVEALFIVLFSQPHFEVTLADVPGSIVSRGVQNPSKSV